jgi:Uma2 family endonuclease
MQSLLENPVIRDAVLRLDIEQYHRLCSSGIIPESTELLEGVVVEKMGKSPLHTWTVAFLEEWFRCHLQTGLMLRVEQPLTLGNSELEPDLAVVEGSRDDFRLRHPASARIVIEVAITTADMDRAKAAIYATAGISQYLLVQPEQKLVVVFENCIDQIYTTKRTLGNADSLVLPDVCSAELNLSELFPK